MFVRYAGRYADLITDFGFKRLFANEHLLIAFINTIVPKADRVKSITYINTVMVGEAVATRTVIYDLRCRTEDGRIIVVEVQRMPQPYFKERTLYYAMRSFAEQVQPGDLVYEVRPVYVIALLDYNLPGAIESPRAGAPAVVGEAIVSDQAGPRRLYGTGAAGYDGFVHRFRLASDAGELFSDVLQLYFVELNKLPMITEIQTEDAPALSALAQWGSALRHMTAMDRVPEWVTDEDLKKAFTAMEVANMSAEERDKWERALAEDRDLRGAVLQQYINGKEEGREEGITIGEVRGRKSQARESAVATVRAMAAEGIDRTIISRVTGLSLDEIADILDSAT